MRILSPALLVLAAASLVAGGCGSRPVWHGQPESATLAYWIEQPALTRVVAEDYGALWDAADDVRFQLGYRAAFDDYRGGLMSSPPQVSPQFFEFWRQELRTLPDIAESSLATVRRRLRLEFGETEDGRFYMEPRVLVERLSLAERRVTSAIDFRNVLGPGRQIGSRLTDRGERVPVQYWYAIGRDEAMERSITHRVSRRTGGIVMRPPRPDPMASAAPR